MHVDVDNRVSLLNLNPSPRVACSSSAPYDTASFEQIASSLPSSVFPCLSAHHAWLNVLLQLPLFLKELASLPQLLFSQYCPVGFEGRHTADAFLPFWSPALIFHCDPVCDSRISLSYIQPVPFQRSQGMRAMRMK